MMHSIGFKYELNCHTVHFNFSATTKTILFEMHKIFVLSKVQKVVRFVDARK